MEHGHPPIVYLDTQDYSRFGSVVEGRGPVDDERLFNDLAHLAKAGDAIFACSMPILGELLSYDETLPHVSEAKATAVETLCRGYALASPSDVVAYELCQLSARESLARPCSLPDLLSVDYGWYPHVDDVFANLRERITTQTRQNLSEKIGMNRQNRRKIDKMLRTMDYSDALNEAAAGISAKYSIPHEVIGPTVRNWFAGRIGSREASRQMFSAIAAPSGFVRAYFQGYDGEKTLPDWISGAGKSIAASLKTFQTAIAQSPAVTDSDKLQLKRLIDEQSIVFGAAAIELGRADAIRVGLPESVVDLVKRNPAYSSKLSVADAVGRVFSVYLKQILGLTGPVAKIESSFGGDVVHALYLAHVDLWRADRRFGHVAASALRDSAAKIVSRVADLPGRIRAWPAV